MLEGNKASSWNLTQKEDNFANCTDGSTKYGLRNSQHSINWALTLEGLFE